MIYYNEWDLKTSVWLLELSRHQQVPVGYIDTRSIKDVKPSELAGFNQCHLFAGVGGWSEALRLAGWPAGREVWTGSCPCQPFSCAGKGKGASDERHLWPDFLRLIAECRPATIFGEQVASEAGREWLAGVRTDLEALEYAFGAADLCAASVGAPHIRQRLYWVAHAKHAERRKIGGNRENERNGKDFGQQETHSKPRACGEICGLGISDSAGRNTRQSFAEATRHGDSIKPTGHAGGMGDTDSTRYEIGIWFSKDDGKAIQSAPRKTTEQTSAWSDFEVINMLDGKSRRFEPGSFPLAYGIQNRVGLLRGYGNAIVPQVAAAFIQAFLEIV